MKRLWTMAFAVLALLAWSCQKDDSSHEDKPEAPSGISFSIPGLNVPQEGGTWELTVTSPGRPVVGEIPDWLTLSNATYNPETYKITYIVTVSPNNSFTERETSLMLSSGMTSSSTVPFTIKQACLTMISVDKSRIPAAPVNANATEAAKKLYTALLAQYGVKTMSGVQSSMSHTTDYVNAV